MPSPVDLRPIAVLGLSHRTAPVEVRERLAFPSSLLSKGLADLGKGYPIREAVILSTCNRVEVYSALEDDADPRVLGQFLLGFHARSTEEVEGRFYVHGGRDAVRHLFRVASSLDSLIVGESQILSQVRQAYLTAKEIGHTARVLNPLFQKALKVGKEVRTKTRIGMGGVSISSVAVRLMKEVVGTLESKVVMLIGSGEMGKLALGNLVRQGILTLLVVNRSESRARELCDRYGGEAIPYLRFPERLPEADVIISSTGAPHTIIHPAEVQRAMEMRKGAPQVYIDIAIPRDVEPGVAEIENVHLFNVDDLGRVIERNLEGWTQEVARGEEIVESQVEAYVAMQTRSDAVRRVVSADGRVPSDPPASGLAPGEGRGAEWHPT